jgi:hypothetical protein
MIYEILNGQTVINTIVADPDFMVAQYPEGNYREVPEPSPVPADTWIITRNAFQNRFPMTANGVSTKYDLMTLFLTDTGYAESLGVTGSDLYSLRSIIITGNNRLGVVSSVNLQAQETIDYVNMTTNAAFPEVFRLTTVEASTLLTTPAAPNETP